MRQAVEHRPLLVLAAALVVGLAWRVNPWLLPLVLLCIPLRRVWGWAVAGLVLGWALAPQPVEPLRNREWVEGSATVVAVPRIFPGQLGLRLRAEGREWQAYLDGCPDLAFGDRLEVAAVGRPLRDGMDAYPRAMGISGRLEIARWRVVERGSGLARLSEAWRRSYRSSLDRWMPPPEAALTEALGLDLEGGIDDEFKQRLRATGTVHIVSASGLHVFVLAAFAMGLLSLLPIPRAWQIVALAGVLALYSVATGLDAPVVRSALMAMVGLTAYLFRRDRDALSALALSGVAYLLGQPRGIFDVGFQLSFVTVGGLILFAHPDRDLPDQLPSLLARMFVGAVRVSWVAFAASAPLVAYHFGSVSLVSLPANLLIGLPVSVVVVGGLVAHLAGLAIPPLGIGLLLWVTYLAAYVRWVVDWLGTLPYAQVAVPAFPWWALAAAYGLLLLLWRPRINQP